MYQVESGTVVDKYTVLRLLGRGGMASVYRVRHEVLGTDYALKVLDIQDPGIQERLLNEGRLQSALRHPNVVAVTDVVTVGDRPGLVMELIEGPDLAELLTLQRLTLDQVDVLAEGILRGVAAAHAQGIVHRDLKPHNILLAQRPDGLLPKVADFGMAKTSSLGPMTATRTGQILGTPAYMAPEQLRDSKDVDVRADVFALGCILYEMVTGERAFRGTDLFQIVAQIGAGNYPPPSEKVPGIPRRMDDAIRGAMLFDRDQRIPDVPTLLELWRGHPVEGRGTWDPELLDLVATHRSGDRPDALDQDTLTCRASGLLRSDQDAPAIPIDVDPERLSALRAELAVEPGSVAPVSASSLSQGPPALAPSAEAVRTRSPLAIGAVVLASLGLIGTVALLAPDWLAPAPPAEGAATTADEPREPAPAAPDPEPPLPRPAPDSAPTVAPAAPALRPAPAPARAPSPAPAPAPAPAPEPEPEPEPTAETTPAEPPADPVVATGTVLLTGDADQAWLVGPSGREPLARGSNPVPVGRYDAIEAAFGDDGRHTSRTTVDLAEGGFVTVRCTAGFLSCKTE